MIEKLWALVPAAVSAVLAITVLTSLTLTTWVHFEDAFENKYTWGLFTCEE
jgi:hypothetical protein